MKRDIDKIYLYAEDPYQAKYQFLTNKRESTSFKALLMILRLLLNTKIIWMIFKKTCKNVIQIKSLK